MVHLPPVPLAAALLALHVGLLLREPHFLPGLNDLPCISLAVWTIPESNTHTRVSQGREALEIPIPVCRQLERSRDCSPGYFNYPQLLPSPSPEQTDSPLVFLGDLPERRREAPDVEGLVAVITQDLAPRLVLPSTHTAGTEPALAAGVVSTVFAIWLLLTRHPLAVCRYRITGEWSIGE